MMTDCKQNSKIGVYLLSLFAILFWGMSYIWSDSLLSMGIPVEYVVFVRIAIAAVFLLFWNIARRKSLRIHRWDVPKFLLVAMFEPLIYFVTETYGIQLTESPTYSSLIIALGPIFSVLVGVLAFREKITIVNIFGILVCLGRRSLLDGIPAAGHSGPLGSRQCLRDQNPEHKVRSCGNRYVPVPYRFRVSSAPLCPPRACGFRRFALSQQESVETDPLSCDSLLRSGFLIVGKYDQASRRGKVEHIHVHDSGSDGIGGLASRQRTSQRQAMDRHHPCHFRRRPVPAQCACRLIQMQEEVLTDVLKSFFLSRRPSFLPDRRPLSFPSA